MIFVLLLSTLVVLSFGAKDPTKVCLPDVFQSVIYSFTSEIEGVMVYDFPNHKLGIRYKNGLRDVYNLADFSAVAINETDNTCVRLAVDESMKSRVLKCLPANAFEATNNNLILGLGANKFDLQAWQVDIPGVGTLKGALTNESPAVPVLKEYRAVGSNVSDVTFFFNTTTTISEPGIFVVPSTCPPPTVVG